MKLSSAVVSEGCALFQSWVFVAMCLFGCECLLIYRAGGLSGEESTCQCRRHRQEMWVQSPGQEDPLEEEIETQSSVLAWKIPYAEEPGRLQTMRSQRVGHD